MVKKPERSRGFTPVAVAPQKYINPKQEMRHHRFKHRDGMRGPALSPPSFYMFFLFFY
jgi:hypothetical protein